MAALPLYVQRLGQLLNLSPLLDHVEKVFAGSEGDHTKRYECCATFSICIYPVGLPTNGDRCALGVPYRSRVTFTPGSSIGFRYKEFGGKIWPVSAGKNRNLH